MLRVFFRDLSIPLYSPQIYFDNDLTMMIKPKQKYRQQRKLQQRAQKFNSASEITPTRNNCNNVDFGELAVEKEEKINSTKADINAEIARAINKVSDFFY